MDYQQPFPGDESKLKDITSSSPPCLSSHGISLDDGFALSTPEEVSAYSGDS